MADEKEVSLQSALKEFTIVAEIVASWRREYLFIFWKMLLKPHGNKLTNSNQLNAGKPTVTLCICNYVVLGLL